MSKNVGGWVLMLLPRAAILALLVFPLIRTLREKDEEPAASERDLAPSRGTGEEA